jgi:hypothetical protein
MCIAPGAYLGQGRLVPIRIRVFLEFLTQHIKINDAPPTQGT